MSFVKKRTAEIYNGLDVHNAIAMRADLEVEFVGYWDGFGESGTKHCSQIIKEEVDESLATRYRMQFDASYDRSDEFVNNMIAIHNSPVVCEFTIKSLTGNGWFSVDFKTKNGVSDNTLADIMDKIWFEVWR